MTTAPPVTLRLRNTRYRRVPPCPAKPRTYNQTVTAGSTDQLIGRLLDGRYQVRSRIARGGMATVYLATDLRLERKVALKVMHGQGPVVEQY